MKIADRVKIIFGIILFILLSSFLYANHYLDRIVKDTRLLNSAEIMVEDILQIRRHEKNFILRGQPEYIDIVKQYLAYFLYEVEDYKKSAYRKTDLRNSEELLTQTKIFQKEFDDWAAKYRDSRVRPESKVLILSGRVMLGLCESLRDESSASVFGSLGNIVTGKIIVLLLFILMGLITFWSTSHRVVKPIRKLQRLCQEIGKEGLLNSGQLKLVDRMLRDLNTKDEIGELAHAYKEMLIRYNNSCIGLQQKMREIEALYNLKSEFTSTVTHELRTPLAPIKEGIELVLDGSSGSINENQKGFLEIAKRNADRLSNLINDVLDFSKLTSKKVELRTELASLNEIIASVVDIYRLVAERKGLYINSDLETTRGLKMELDPDRINQVITNLTANAIKFTDKGGITIKTFLEKEPFCVKVCVEDTGIGIEEKNFGELFKPFSQLGDKNTKKRGGTGLGLAICKEIIEQSGGKIWVESEFGKGSKFYFRLPIKGGVGV